jgi:hypothetical protein
MKLASWTSPARDFTIFAPTAVGPNATPGAVKGRGSTTAGSGLNECRGVMAQAAYAGMPDAVLRRALGAVFLFRQQNLALSCAMTLSETLDCAATFLASRHGIAIGSNSTSSVSNEMSVAFLPRLMNSLNLNMPSTPPS